MKKKLLSLLLAAIMVVAVLPMNMLAATESLDDTSSGTVVTPVPSTKNQMSYVSSVKLDGKNTNGEYDDAYTVQINIGGTGNPADNGDRYRVVYTDDAIYVLIEAYDTTFNHKYAYSYTGVSIPAEGSKGDNVELYFKIGNTFVGSKQRFRDSNPGANNYGGTKTWNYNNSAFIDYHATRNNMTTTTGYSYEMMFPVSELTEAEKAAFKNGTLDVRFSALMRDGASTYHMDNWEANKFWNGADYVKYYNKFTFKDKALCTDYTKREVLYKDAVVLDGANTLGEYDDATFIRLNGMNRCIPDEGDGYRILYTPEGIYVYIEVYDTTFDNKYNRSGFTGVGTSADYIDFYFKIGETFAGRKQRFRDSDPAASNYGGAKAFNITNGVQTEFNSTVDGKIVTTGFAYEVFFPVSEMTDADKVAYQNGTLDVRFAVMLQDYSGDYVCDSASGLSLWNGASYFSSYSVYTLGEPAEDFELSLFGRDMKYSETAKLDGKNTNGEYDGAYVNPICIGGKGDDGAGDIYRVIYTDEAIYILVEVVDDTIEYYYERTVNGVHYPASGSNGDNIQLYFRIGESFIGTKQHYRDSYNPINQFGGEIDMREGYGRWDNENDWLICVNNKENGMTMEMRFPVDKMTQADQVKFRNRTLDVGFSAFVRNGANTYHGDCKDAISFWNGASYVNKYPTFSFRPYILSDESFSTENGEVINIPVMNKISLKHTAALIDPNYVGAQMQYTIGNNTPIVVSGVLVDEEKQEYEFSYEVPYTAMSECVKVELVKNGVVLKKVDSYVIVDYCQELLEQTAEELGITENQYQSMKNFVKAVLDLGAASDAMIGNTNDPVNEGIEVVLPDYSYTTKDVVIDKHTTLYDIEVLGIGVYYNADANTLNQMFIKIKTASPDNVRISFATGRILYLTNLTLVPVAGEADTYMAVTPVIDAEDFNKDFVMNVSYDEGNHVINSVYKITGNINAGLVELMEDADYGALALATYNYGVAVKFYKAS